MDLVTCWPWETAAKLLSARQRKALRRHGGGEGRGAHRGGHPPTAYFLKDGLKDRVMVTHKQLMQQDSIESLQSDRELFEEKLIVAPYHRRRHK